MSPAAFLASFPLFAKAPPSLIAAKLAEAAARMGGPNALVWGPFAAPAAPALATLPLPPAPLALADLGQSYLAAHLLVSDPFGTSLRLDGGSTGRSTWLDRFEELESGVACASGFIVSGGS